MIRSLKRNMIASFDEGGWSYGIRRGLCHRQHEQPEATSCICDNRLLAV